jgi:hypothetical protein
MANLVVSEPVAGFDLEITIRPHSSRVVFGDPLYVEMTFTNRGRTEIEIPTLSPRSNSERFDFGFRIYNPEARLLIHEGNGAQGKPREFGDDPMKLAPGEAVRHYWIVFLPKLQDFKSTFWSPLRDRGKVMIRSVYILGESRDLALLGDPHEIVVDARDEMEMQALTKWAKIGDDGVAKGPSPADLGIAFGRPLNRLETADVAAEVRGELADLLRLSLRLQELYAMAPEAEEAACAELIEWLRKQPDIKRQTFLQAARRIAEAYEPRMFVTADALKQAQRND